MDFLKKIWQGWQAFGRFLGNVIGRVILSVFYFTIMLPFSLGVTLFGDALKLKEKRQTFWLNRQTPPISLEAVRRQF